MQDEHHSSGSSSGFGGSMGSSGNTSTYVPSVGASISQDGITPGVSINQSDNNADSAWVNNQTTVIGKDSVTVTADTTNIKGGVIANIDENGQAIYEQVTKEQTFPKFGSTSDSSSVSIQSPYTISFDNMGQKEIDNLFAKAFGGNAPGSTYNHATVDLTNQNAIASMPESVQNMLGQAVDDVNAFLAKNWDNSEVRTGAFGVQEAMWNSVPGQTVSGTFGVIGDTGRLSLDSIAWGGIQLGKQAGLLDNVNTDYELNVFSNSAGTIGQWYVDNVNEERRKDLSLLGDITLIYGGIDGIAGKTFKKAGKEAVTDQGGLNLFKWNQPQTINPTGWKNGDYMLYLPDQGTPKANWKTNYGALRREMSYGNPIYDSYKYPNGELIPTGGFLNSERYILQERGWTYNEKRGAWLPPNE